MSDVEKCIKILKWADIELDAGLSEDELIRAEEVIGARFPPDLRELLSCALPVGQGWHDWRTLELEAIERALQWPWEGMAFDIEHNDFWFDEWEERPVELQDALAYAQAQLLQAPTLIPIYRHRYIPAEPELAGNPIFSVYQNDIIYYGSNLTSYLHCELGALDYRAAISGELRPIRFWGDLMW